MGFLNPWLYSTADSSAGAIYGDATVHNFASHVVLDVTDGNNGAGCCPGFDAKAGWDPVSGRQAFRTVVALLCPVVFSLISLLGVHCTGDGL